MDASGLEARFINGQRVSRSVFTAMATDPQSSIVVQACAGAGKTELLVQRMLRLLQSGVLPSEILAITFTKKAAGEMRERLMGELQKPQNQSTFRRVVASGQAVEIRTFHAWFASVIGLCPLAVRESLGLPAVFEVTLETDRLQARAWALFHTDVSRHDKLRAAYNSMVSMTSRHGLRAVLDSVLSKRSEFKLAVLVDAPGGSQPDWRDAFPDLADPKEPWRSPVSAFWQGNGVLRTLNAAVEASKSISHKSHLKALAGLEQAVANRDFEALRQALLTQSDEPKKRVLGTLGDRPDLDEAQILVLAAVHAQMAFEQWAYHQHALVLAKPLIAAYDRAQHELGLIDLQTVELAALRLLQDTAYAGWMSERLDARISQVLIDEFQDTNPLQWLALSQWLGSYSGVGAGKSLKVFVVGDAKQSIYGFRGAQAGVFEAATEFLRQVFDAQLLKTHHSFRCGPAVIDLVNNVFSPLATVSTGLPADEPSIGPVLPGFETHSGEPEREGLPSEIVVLPGIPYEANKREPVTQRSDASTEWPPMECAFDLARSAGSGALARRASPITVAREREVQQAAVWIESQIRLGVPASEILVLAREHKAFSNLGQRLRERGIAFVQHQDRELMSALEVEDVLALLDALASPSHDLSLAKALKSPLLGWSDEDLIGLARVAQTLAVRQSVRSSWWEALLQSLQKGEREIAVVCGQEDENRLSLRIETAQRLARWSQWAHDLPPHDALTRILAERDASGADAYARYAQRVPRALRDSVVSNLHALVAATLAVRAGRFISLYGFVRECRRLQLKAAPITADNAVRGMTIHSAKGLQATVVLWLDTDPSSKSRSAAGLHLHWPADAAAPKQALFVYGKQRPEFARVWMEEAERRSRLEDLNLAYVAMTRARRTLALSAHAPRTKADVSMWDRVRSRIPELAEPIQDTEGALTAFGTPGSEDEVLATRLPQISLLKMSSVASSAGDDAVDFESIGPFQSAGPVSVAARMGAAVHRLLEWLPLRGHGQSAQIALADAEIAARACGLAGADAEDLRATALSIANGDAAWAWHRERVDQASNEVALQLPDGRWGRADRIVRTVDGTWWVLDYKTSASQGDGDASPAVRQQLLRYATALEATGVLPVRTAWISADGRLHEFTA